MNKKGMNFFVRLTGSILAAALLFLSTGLNVHAQNSQQKYKVKIYFGTDTSLCVGQTTTLTVAYNLIKGQKEKAPPIFSFKVTNGNVTSENPTTGGAGTGFVFFDFKATEAGVAQLSAQANQSDGSDTKSIQVKEDCQYSYNLIVTLRASSSLDGVVLKWKDTLSTKGTFKPLAADLAPLAPLSPNGQMDATLTILDEQLPDQDECNVPATKWTGLQGSGTVIASGQMLNNGREGGVRFVLSRVEMKHDPTFNTPCKAGPLIRTLSLDFSAANWIQEDFPPEGGSKQIKIETLEKGVALLNKSKGTTASYEAFLEVRRVK